MLNEKFGKVCLILCLISFSFFVNGQVNYEPDSSFVYKNTVEIKLKMIKLKILITGLGWRIDSSSVVDRL